MTRQPTPLAIAAGERSPRVLFDAGKGTLHISGESYPEDAAAFFGPILCALQEQLNEAGPPLQVDLELVYFNSSSAKALMNIFQILESAAARGRQIAINWHYHPDDDTMEEFGQDFAEDFKHADFRVVPRE
ncbi:MAG TPA: DUF1987 domain-containing protein [Kiloniellales bacterium]|jgi:hypothetical protein|nr:DUF1987 domain-containing protein [Kiloniellales bacterium]